MSKAFRSFVCGVFAALALLTAYWLCVQQLSLASPDAMALASAQAQPIEHIVAAPHTPNCGPDWQIIPSSIVSPYELLYGVAAISSNDVWAVGRINYKSLIEHWDGSTWSVVPSPAPLDGNELYGITALSTNDVWAVGSYVSGGETTRYPLSMHWDGSAWSLVPAPAPNGSTFSYLKSVDALSANDVWAVGLEQPAENQTLTEHWDGSLWSVVPSPNVDIYGNSLNGVAAVSSNDVWAVGYHNRPGTSINQTLIEHWDGSVWSVVPSPNVDIYGNSLNGVAAISSNDVWAVGSSLNPAMGDQTLTEHWDGSLWSVVPSPNGDTGSGIFYGVVALSSSDVWAVGASSYTYTRIEHWNGTLWNVVPSPSVNTYYSRLNGVAATSSNDVWAVGSYSGMGGVSGVLIERYNPSYCPTPSPAPRCPGERFTDVCPSDYFYQHVLDLNNLSAIRGYNTVPPCDGLDYIPCFKPYNWTTRGQLTKIVSIAAGFTDPDPNSNTFTDVQIGTTYHVYVERLLLNRPGVINGYPCGGTNPQTREAEPCDAQNRPYFRSGNTVSRGQLTKIAALTFGFNQPVSTQTFEDVPPSYTFYQYVERLAVQGIVSGYDCGNPEPCVPPGNRPYFRPANTISRGQIAKIVNLARIASSTTPSPTVTATVTSTPTIPLKR